MAGRRHRMAGRASTTRWDATSVAGCLHSTFATVRSYCTRTHRRVFVQGLKSAAVVLRATRHTCRSVFEHFVCPIAPIDMTEEGFQCFR